MMGVRLIVKSRKGSREFNHWDARIRGTKVQGFGEDSATEVQGFGADLTRVQPQRCKDSARIQPQRCKDSVRIRLGFEPQRCKRCVSKKRSQIDHLNFRVASVVCAGEVGL
jgi:hypothetical protein